MLRSATRVSPGRIWLAAGDFGEFARFVTEETGDSRAASTMTAAAPAPALLARIRAPVPGLPRR